MLIKPLHAAAALLCLVPALGRAGTAPGDTGVCPRVDEVIATISPASDWLAAQDLVAETGAAASSQDAVDALVARIETHVPQASPADVADLMIGSYCDFLATSQPDVNLPASVRAFETVVYASLPTASGAERGPAPKPKAGWLYSGAEGTS